MNTPVAFIIFNRPDNTKEVFARIAQAKPKKIFVIADGPRDDHPDDAAKCNAARAVIERIDWDCEVFKNYSDVNLGCGRRPATGISWVFENVEEAIILEDDCVPNPTFFQYCEELLNRFHNDERIMTISGMKTDFGQQQRPYSYSFRLMPQCCGGWATWRRAWQHYDFEIKQWSELRDSSWLLDITENPRAVEYYQNIFDRTYKSRLNLDYWDYQWVFTCWSQNGLAIIPSKNLIKNIGFGPDATHSISVKHYQKFMNFSVEEMGFPLEHPPYMIRDKEADLLRFKVRFPEENKPSWYNRIYNKCYNLSKYLRGQQQKDQR